MSGTTKSTLAEVRAHLISIPVRLSGYGFSSDREILAGGLRDCLVFLLDEVEALKLCVAHPLVTMPAMPNDGPSPVERELWEALDRLLVNLSGPAGIYLKSLTIAEAVRDRLRPLMNEGKPS